MTHRYGAVLALDDVSLELAPGSFVALVGPDGVGKSTLLALLAGARRIQEGSVEILGADMRDAGQREAICPRIAYMPQGLGRNLYPDLTVRENITFFARLFGQDRVERDARMATLLRATDLAPFADRAAKNLSGGMRQKLGLCCALIHDPDLLILDEPTTGVDPLSRRQFWDLIERLREANRRMGVVVATAYMDEAERFERIVAMNAGRILADGTPEFVKHATGTATLEDAFVALLPRTQAPPRPAPPPLPEAQERVIAIEAHDLTRRFDGFTAVDRASFTIARGEIFGFLGSNGCGKTTTMRMLTGLLPATEGEAFLFGQPIDASDRRMRERVGYMSQSFSLYAELTVRQNLDLHARLYHLPRAVARERLPRLVEEFGLGAHLDQEASSLPLGIRQRLSLAVAVVHDPDLLILDEPTSGVDPVARDRFWDLLTDMSRRRGVTIFVSTHFMNEAARCDRVSLMHAGRVLATGTPAELTRQFHAQTLEGAFIACLEQATGAAGPPEAPLPVPHHRRRRPALAWLQRPLAYAIREALELSRDRIRLAFAFLGTAFLMLVFGYGINTDVDNLRFAVLDRDNTHESRVYTEQFRGSAYFTEAAPLASYADIERRLAENDIKLAIEIPAGFGRALRAGRPTEVGVWIDGAMPFRAETTKGYVQGVHALFLQQLGALRPTSAKPLPVAIEARFRYNQDFDSVNAMVPSTLAMQLALIPAILMALAIVREKELGSITNLYVTPVTRLEFIIGKQIPYVVISMMNFIVLTLMAIFIFGVPLKGSFAALATGALVYVTATTGYGLVISAFASTQIAALFGTAILTVLPATQFSGMLAPVSTLSGIPAVMSSLFPMSYFIPISVGAFTKSLGFAQLWSTILQLSLFLPGLTLLSVLLMREQER